MSKKIKLAYIITACLHLASLFDPPGQVWITDWLYVITKMLLMPLLMVLAFYYGRELKRFWNKWRMIMLALFFSFLGDFFLMDTITFDSAFVVGLSCFLVTHLLYIRTFLRGKAGKFIWKPVPVISLIILILAWAGWIFTLLLPELGELLLPVGIYIIVISFMAIAAVLRYGFCDMVSYRFVLAGAFAFMFSDMFVAWRMFIADFSYAGLIIMSFYILAQYLIVEGLYRQDLVRIRGTA